MVIDAIEEMISAGEEIEISGFLDDNEENTEIYGYKRLGSIEEAESYKGNLIHLAVGNNGFRKKFYEENKGFEYLTVIHPKSIVSRRAELEEGCFIGAGAAVNADTVIGRLSIVNTKAVIEHDCEIGRYSHISYGVILGGGSGTDERVFIDMGITVERNKKIKLI
ncbi:hypothetical protein PM10SUCC1_24230 [Propionigenium maris DSM 9537]|uniref:PglD N-terminal domain-containing protein n=1 Tax=Propionigenium maris DSM 9537 TaxID=1123000 RepID=A0A9W6GN75_9FUSO|nr:hypothetical protein PM10SUCC1_24230 [Propionigenium maris DSM 9537]